jgi:streptogramin lyase
MLFGTKRDANVYAFDAAGHPAGASYSFTNAQLSQAAAIAVGQDGLVYVYDDADGQVLRFTQAGGFVDVFSSTGQTGMTTLTFDANGDLYLAGSLAGVYKVSGATGSLIGRYDSGVPLGVYKDIVFTGTGEVYLASLAFGDSYLYRLNADGSYAETVFTNSNSILNAPYSLISGGGDLVYVMNHGSSQILSFDADAQTLTVLASGVTDGNSLVLSDDGFYATAFSSGTSKIFEIDGSGTNQGIFGGDVNPLFIAGAVPEPATVAFVVTAALGLLVLVIRRRRR